MHYYQFNIADYRKDTQHLTPMEHYIYRELMDWYYLEEAPIPEKTHLVIRRLRLVSENNQLVLNVLEEFFFLTEKGWEHKRINQEIGSYQRKAETARANGSKGGRPKKPRKTQPVNLANPDKTQTKANHKPLTINQDIKESTNVDSSSEPSRAQSLTAVITIPTNRNATTGEEYPVTQQQIDDWSSSYPAVDVMQQLRTMRSWSINNPTKRKTIKGMNKFIDAWLSREQDRGRNHETGGQIIKHPSARAAGISIGRDDLSW